MFSVDNDKLWLVSSISKKGDPHSLVAIREGNNQKTRIMCKLFDPFPKHIIFNFVRVCVCVCVSFFTD